jgi:predicted transposase YdaD
MTNRPHDALFKAAFESPEHAGALFRELLPTTVCDAIAWDTLKSEPGSFIDTELKDRHSDLLFSVMLAGSPVLLYLLLEHQSSNDRFMLLRMLGYIVRILDQYAKKAGTEPLPLIIPMVISHAPGGWTAPRSFAELFEPHPASVPGLAQFFPDFTMLVDDLSHLDDVTLHQRTLAAFPKLALWLLRDARSSPRFLDNIEQWVGAFGAALRAPHGMAAVKQLISYIALVVGSEEFEYFRETICATLPEVEEAAMTYAEELHQEGLEKGLEKGCRKGRVETLEKLMTLKFGGLPAEAQARVEAASDEELERYIERILGAKTLESVFTG